MQSIQRILAAAILGFAALPAHAQFGTIFDDRPPRPPSDVPRPPSDIPQQRGPVLFPGRDEPPSQPIPPPMSQPPSRRPGGGSIQTQPLGPPPGGMTPPADARGTIDPRQPLPTPSAPDQQQAAPGAPLAPGPRGTRGAPPPQPANTAPQPGDEIVVQPPEQKIANPTAVFSGLDKITGRTISFDVAINETVQFGALQVTPRVCYSRPPTETPNTDVFVVVDEVTLQGEVKRIFSGWMFASSPGLHAVEHPIYDVWLTECKGATPPAVAEAPSEQPTPAANAAKPTTPRQPRQPAPRRPAPSLLPPFR